MRPLELTLAVVGIIYQNPDKTNRGAELVKCAVGEPIELRPEPTNEHDRNAVAVFSARGIQIGYLTRTAAPNVGELLAAGEPVEAIFQGLDVSAAYIRVRFGGGAPTIPVSQGGEHFVETDPWWAGGGDGFVPDPEGPMWGA